MDIAECTLSDNPSYNYCKLTMGGGRYSNGAHERYKKEVNQKIEISIASNLAG